MTAAFAGVLVAPLTLTGATMGAVLGLKAFAVAIIGGLTSGHRRHRRRPDPRHRRDR